MGHFEDGRLPELLFRYRARNYPNTLNKEEQIQWHHFCKARLQDISKGAPITLEQFNSACQELFDNSDIQQQQILTLWQNYIAYLEQKYL